MEQRMICKETLCKPMSEPKSSIYCYLFNAKKFSFSYRETLTNFSQFADEVVVATIKDEDNTAALLHELAKELPNLKVVETDIVTTSNRFDGLLKTAALKATIHPIKIIADCDEVFILAQKPLWEERYKWLMNANVDGILVPVIDLYGSPEKIRAEGEIGQKFRIHKSTVVERGVIKSAELYNGRFRTDMSDCTEPLNANGDLARFTSFTQRMALFPAYARFLEKDMYVVHEGYLSLENRAKINKEFWKEKWQDRSGIEENVVTDLGRLQRTLTVEHGLPIR